MAGNRQEATIWSTLFTHPKYSVFVPAFRAPLDPIQLSVMPKNQGTQCEPTVNGSLKSLHHHKACTHQQPCTPTTNLFLLTPLFGRRHCLWKEVTAAEFRLTTTFPCTTGGSASPCTGEQALPPTPPVPSGPRCPPSYSTQMSAQSPPVSSPPQSMHSSKIMHSHDQSLSHYSSLWTETPSLEGSDSSGRPPYDDCFLLYELMAYQAFQRSDGSPSHSCRPHCPPGHPIPSPRRRLFPPSLQTTTPEG
ncbi:hypothetical protein DFS34DRAFT_297605 [Phlyctochytrium arcticum]|nr:hypothetical protein DFS34DRAFT_297605 [Phlyctochytrium arcticum]